MKSIKPKVSVALAASLAFSTTASFASTSTERRAALNEIREMREDTRVVTKAEMPALREAMALESPSAPRIASVLHSRTPTGRLFVKFITEPNPDVAITYASDLVDEIFSNRGKPSEKLFLTKTNVESLDVHGLYDTPIRAKVSLLDTMIVNRLKKDRTARIAAGDVVILLVASGFALHAGFNGTNRTAAALREVNWKALPGEVKTASGEQLSNLLEGGRNFATGTAEASQSAARAVATRANVGYQRIAAKVAKDLSAAQVQSEVNMIYATFEAQFAKSPMIEQALNITENASVRTTEYFGSQVQGLKVGLNRVTGETTQVVFQKEVVKDSMRKVATFTSEPVPDAEADRLLHLFIETKPLRLLPVGLTGRVRRVSPEIKEAGENMTTRLIAGAKNQGVRAQTAIRETFEDFDRTAAVLEGSKIGAVGIIAWHAGHAFGFDDGQDHAVTYLEEQIAPDRLQPVEVTPPAH